MAFNVLCIDIYSRCLMPTLVIQTWAVLRQAAGTQTSSSWGTPGPDRWNVGGCAALSGV